MLKAASLTPTSGITMPEANHQAIAAARQWSPGHSFCRQQTADFALLTFNFTAPAPNPNPHLLKTQLLPKQLRSVRSDPESKMVDVWRYQ